MIFQRSFGYIAFKERPDYTDAGLGPTVGASNGGGAGPPDTFTLFDRTGDIIQDRTMSAIETRV